MELDRTERRILGALVEKRLSTPDQYPLTMKALMAAVNQKSNRDPVLALEEFEVEGALLSLREKGLILIREREGGWAKRYAEKLTGELGTDERASAVLTELMLRGDQTAPELLRRIARMVRTESQNQVDASLTALTELHLVRLTPRASGQRHARWTHLLAPAGETAPAPVETAPAPVETAAPESPVAPPPAPAPDALEEIRAEMESLREEVADLRDRVGRIEDAYS